MQSPVSRGALGAAAVVAVALGAAVVVTHPVTTQKTIDVQARNQAISPSPGTKGAIDVSYPPGVLPDPRLTPGKANPALTMDVLFAPGFTTTKYRHVTETDRKAVFARYGIAFTPENRKAFETDHALPVECGGDNTTEDPRAPDYLTNLWSEPWSVNVNGRDYGAHVKDLAENAVRRAVKDGRISLPDAQRGFQTDWTQLYRRFVSPEFPSYPFHGKAE